MKLIKKFDLPNGGRIEYSELFQELVSYGYHDSFYGTLYLRDTYDNRNNLIRRVANGFWWERAYDEQNRKVYEDYSFNDYKVKYKYVETESGFELKTTVIQK